MRDLTNNVYFKVVIMIAIIAYAVYNLWKVTRTYIKHIKAKKEFSERSKKYSKQQDYTIWVVVYAAVCIGAFVMMIIDIIDKDYVMASAFFFMGTFCISFVMDALMTRQSLFDEDGFFFEIKYYRYRSVMKLEPRRSLIASYDMYLTGGESIRISRKMGDELQKRLKMYKNRKKK